MTLLDTTILVYAVGDPHPFRAPCRLILQAQAEGRVDAATTVEVLQEFVHVRAQRRSRADAAALGRHFAAALPILSASREDLELALTLFELHPPLGAFDSVLAAVGMNRGVEGLVSADRAFAGLDGLRWIEPGSLELGGYSGG